MQRLEVVEKFSECPREFQTEETTYHGGIAEYNTLAEYVHICMYTYVHTHAYRAFSSEWLSCTVCRDMRSNRKPGADVC